MPIDVGKRLKAEFEAKLAESEKAIARIMRAKVIAMVGQEVEQLVAEAIKLALTSTLMAITVAETAEASTITVVLGKDPAPEPTPEPESPPTPEPQPEPAPAPVEPPAPARPDNAGGNAP